MEFITILFALAVNHYYKQAQNYRACGWFEKYCNWIQSKTESFMSIIPSAEGPVNLIILLAPILILLGIVANILSETSVFFSFLFGLVILIYSIGPRDITSQVEKYIEAASAGDNDTALNSVNEFFSGHCYQPNIKGSANELAAVINRGILIAFNNRIIAVLFWFILLGPLGALLFRLTNFLYERFAGGYFASESDEFSDFALAIRRLYMILGWIPARLCSLTYALAGNFSATLLCWHCVSDFFNQSNDELIVASGLHALNLDENANKDDANASDSNTTLAQEQEIEDNITGVESVLGLIRWSLLIVVTIVSLMTIVGWIY